MTGRPVQVRTPAQWLAPEPPPVRTERSRSVVDWLIGQDRAVVGIRGETPRARMVAELLLERREQGIERYQQELVTHCGRDPRVDLMQELVDSLMYAALLAMESGESIDRGRVMALFRFVEELLPEP